MKLLSDALYRHSIRVPPGALLHTLNRLEVRFAAGPVDPAKLMSLPGGVTVNTAKLRLRRQGVH